VPYTFECGTCNSVYRLDENQITAQGVKVTCPKCLSFFLLKAGTRATERPVVEHVVPDGQHVVELAEVPSEATEILAEPPPAPPPPRKPPQDGVLPTREGLPETSHKQIVVKELPDPPLDPKPTGRFVSNVLVPLAFILLAAGALLFLNFRGFIRIPGFERYFPAAGTVLPAATPSPGPASTPRYGFPQVDPGYDAWGDQKPGDSTGVR
jgi:predicted Zn finger-like uncharacterized protein